MHSFYASYKEYFDAHVETCFDFIKEILETLVVQRSERVTFRGTRTPFQALTVPSQVSHQANSQTPMGLFHRV